MQRMQATCWARLWSGRRPAAILRYIICHEIFISVWNQMLLICMLPYLMYLVLQWYGSPLILHVTIPYRRPLVCLEDVTAGFYVCLCENNDYCWVHAHCLSGAVKTSFVHFEFFEMVTTAHRSGTFSPAKRFLNSPVFSLHGLNSCAEKEENAGWDLPAVVGTFHCKYTINYQNRHFEATFWHFEKYAEQNSKNCIQVARV